MTTPPCHNALLARILWRIETDLDSNPTLADLSESLGLSRFYLTRTFALLTGKPLMTYVRARRLTEAAAALAHGRETVTGAGLAAGYDAAESFSRAFRAAFGVAPSSIRGPDDLGSLNLQEPLNMPETPNRAVSPTIRTGGGQKICGFADRFTMDTRTRIPALWNRTASELGRHMTKGTFGVCYDFRDDGSFSYLAGAAEADFPDTDGLDSVTLPAGTYAVTEHSDHISTIGETWDAIFSAWAPNAPYEILTSPEFEFYEPDFDPAGQGRVSIWIPVAPKT